MRDPRDLYRFEDTEVLSAVPRGDLTLVHTLPGIVDAGNSCKIAAAYLRDQLRHLPLVTFAVDELLDYRGSRPQSVFNGVSFTSVEIPSLTITLMYDDADRPFLLLDGPEPDMQWQRLAQAVIDLVEFFEITCVVGIQAIPMAVPHTRPIGLIAHANDPSLLRDDDRLNPTAVMDEHTPGEHDPETSQFVIPASFGSYLEYELGRASLPAMGYAAQIPHYLTRTDFPAGALALLRRVSEAASLEFPLVGLGDLVDAAGRALHSTVDANPEVEQIVTTLEEQYDQMTAQGSGGVATTMDLPTADEIGDRFERFLADQNPGDDGAQPRL